LGGVGAKLGNDLRNKKSQSIVYGTYLLKRAGASQGGGRWAISGCQKHHVL